MNALWNAACLLLCVVVNIDASDGPPPCLEDRKYAIDVITHQGFCEVCPKCDGGGFFKNTQVFPHEVVIDLFSSLLNANP